jgi:predicted O-linked N-acetylglucosamine transferase (SPINDLY family)
MAHAGRQASSKLLARAQQGFASGNLAEAERNCGAILKAQPDHVDALHLLGLVHLQRNELADAHRLLTRVLALRPGAPAPLHNCGIVLHKLRRPAEALACYDQALAARGEDPVVLNDRGNALRDLRRHQEALASYDRALVLRPDYADALNNRGIVFQQLQRLEEALASFDRAIAIRADHSGALYNRGTLLAGLKRYDEAIVCYERALAANPRIPYAFAAMANAAVLSCDWARMRAIAGPLIAHVERATAVIDPFTFIGYGHDPRLQLQCTRTFLNHLLPSRPEPLWRGTVWTNDRIRLAYLSADFRQHATTLLITELMEIHSRSRFEVVGISFGPDDRSAARARVAAAFDHFYDVRAASDHDVATRMHSLRVDIAVDLNGYTTGCRPGILAHRPAPIQVNWLAYPGTMAADFIDYVVADPIVLPFDQQPFYAERIVHLPDCFQVNDSHAKAAPAAPTRQEAGLPETGFVFCCFNNNWKIVAPMFDIWMRLLREVDGSVLWLLRENQVAARHLCDEARARGIDPARLVFAPKVDHDVHLARHVLADIFLDTLPINAGTTASDALRAGLPVLTCASGRIAASLLHAIGLDDLVAPDPAAYEALALRLARDGALLASVRARLARNRRTHPLFDTRRFRDHIEAAYERMWELWQRGERPQSFRIAPSTPQTRPGL